MKNLFFISAFIVLFFSCNDSSSNPNVLLPDPIGGADELMFIFNDSYLTEELSKTIKKTIVEEYKILPQSQARFLVSSVKFSKLNTILKRFINPIFVVTKNEKSAIASYVNQFLTTLEKTQINDASQSIFFKKNLWAKNQNIIIVVAENKEAIIATLNKNKNAINAYYDKSNLIHYKKLTYIDGVNKALNKQFKEYYNFTFDIPIGYQIAKNEKNAILLRKDEDKSTLFLAIDITDYNDSIPINNLGIEKFNELGKHLDGMKEGSYVIADTTLGFDISKTVVNNVTIFENAGLWVMENDFVGGGPFINQYIIDNNNNRIIYLSGMVYGPAEKNKKKYMRQFEAIFNSLKL